jgi:hypothetical protein
MRVREWTLENTIKHGTEDEPMKVYTTPGASQEVAYRKMRFKIPAEYQCFVGVRRGRVVEL